jgi:KTSC domain
MDRIAVDSSAVISIGYEAATERLEVEFKNGRIYAYEKVPRSVFEWLLRIPNKGGFITRVLEPTYRGTAIEKEGVGMPDLETALRASLGDPAKDPPS